tara:strand:+ start:44 stop:274 length:231 start_codon:yes stop_codon:yes gene_type:complete
MADTEKRLLDLERQISELQQTGVNKKKDKKPRPPSKYNIFMGQFITEQKNKLGEKYNHKETFKLGAAAWKKSTEKP